MTTTTITMIGTEITIHECYDSSLKRTTLFVDTLCDLGILETSHLSGIRA